MIVNAYKILTVARKKSYLGETIFTSVYLIHLSACSVLVLPYSFTRNLTTPD
jgi:hypothetical protein